ncbi:MAG: hypothetical protein OEU90_05365 [Gammaproteobacteria bacterium]|jgi:hypothetical protein|nr:hypothetical protein [Gammaproteobacteria bacterium]MDH3750156.1 hypothetical protein [Gammaproteobacteria bacterium]MDH3804890.1 hypothetical protein [Gammaproteobacteria bacterium]
MRTTSTFIAVITATILIVPGATFAENEKRPPLYVSVDCMKSTAADYSSVETEIWQPMHQELVNQGKRNSWALYYVMYGDRSKCDYYTVTTYLGQEQLNAGLPIREAFESVHKDKKFAKAMARTWASREHVATELWVLVDSTDIAEHNFAVVNTMYAEDPDAYERMETRIFKPGHQALVDGGHRAGWGMYELVSPVGTSIPYNYSTVDFVSDLNPVPMAEAMLAAHPDRDLEAMQEMLELRDNISSETWALVAATVSPPAQ